MSQILQVLFEWDGCPLIHTRLGHDGSLWYWHWTGDKPENMWICFEVTKEQLEALFSYKITIHDFWGQATEILQSNYDGLRPKVVALESLDAVRPTQGAYLVPNPSEAAPIEVLIVPPTDKMCGCCGTSHK